MSYLLIKSSAFQKKASKILKSQPDLYYPFLSVLSNLQENPFQPQLKTHKLKGKLSGSLACYLTFDLRIIFKIIDNYQVQNQETASGAILLQTIGTHDEVY